MVGPAIRIACVILCLCASSAAPCEAAAPSGPRRVGVVVPVATSEQIQSRTHPMLKAFEGELRARGWVPGRNVEVRYRPIGGLGEERARAEIEDLLRWPADAIVAVESAAYVTMDATRTVPIVAILGGEAVQSGRIASLSRPGGNVTGYSSETQGSLATKRLALLRETTRVSRVARFYLGAPLRFGDASEILPEYGVAARALGLEIITAYASTPVELRQAFAELARRGVDGLSVRGYLEPAARRTFFELLERHRLPAVFDSPLMAGDEGLMAYGENREEVFRMSARTVDRILRGEKPGDIPIQQPEAFSFIVNLKAAKAIGLEVPASVRLQADRLIK